MENNTEESTSAAAVSAKDTAIELAVDTSTISETTKNMAVTFSDDVNTDPGQSPGDPENYVSSVWKNCKISWTAKVKDSSRPVNILEVSKDGGSTIMEEIKRGSLPNVFTAKIKGNARPNDTESYSVTIGVYTIKGIAGNNSTGPIVYYDGSLVAYMNSYDANVWHEVKNTPFAIQGIAGENNGGAIVYNGSQVAYMNSYSNNQWHEIHNAPFTIQGIAGNNENGPIVYNGSQVAYMNSYDSNLWHVIKTAPFPIQGLAGDNVGGPIVYNGNRVAYMNSYDANTWHEVANAPFQIQGITGDKHGAIIYSGSQVAYMNSYAANVWHVVKIAPFAVQGIAGENNNGAIIYNGSQVAYMNSYAKNKWDETPAPAGCYTIDPKISVKPNN